MSRLRGALGLLVAIARDERLAMRLCLLAGALACFWAAGAYIGITMSLAHSHGFQPESLWWLLSYLNWAELTNIEFHVLAAIALCVWFVRSLKARLYVPPRSAVFSLWVGALIVWQISELMPLGSPRAPLMSGPGQPFIAFWVLMSTLAALQRMTGLAALHRKEGGRSRDDSQMEPETTRRPSGDDQRV